MARTKLNEPVIEPGGGTTTIATLAEQDEIEFRAVTMTGASGHVTRYFADFKGTTCGWEIGRTAYLSRTGEHPFATSA